MLLRTSARHTRLITLLHPTRSISSSQILHKKKSKIPDENLQEDLRTRKAQDLIPASQLILSKPTDRAEYDKAKIKMQASVTWFQRDCEKTEARARGRISPALLDGIRAKTQKGDMNLEDIATVGIKDGNTIIITVFEEQNSKAVEQALYSAKLPNVIPQRRDAQTIVIPMPKPTGELKSLLFSQASKRAEEQRVHLRSASQAAIKKGGYKKHSQEIETFQKLEREHIAEIDKILKSLKTATSPGK